jgi:hypothetical protein
VSLTPREISRLRKIVALASELLAKSETSTQPRHASKSKATTTTSRKRRSGKELVAFRKMLKAERKRGVAVSQLAQEHGISPAYIYQIG